MKEVNYINGECGEQLLVDSVRLKKNGCCECSCVNIDLDGLVPDRDGNLSITLSPHVAKQLADELIKHAEQTSEENYRLLSGEEALIIFK